MKQKSHYETLDPTNWDESKALMHQMVDDAYDFIKHVRDRKIWQQMPEHVIDSFKTPLPKEPNSAIEVYEELKSNVAPYTMGNIHPRF